MKYVSLALASDWRDQAKKIGKIVPIESARRIPGAFLLRVPRRGKIGHVVVSDGFGGTIEAMGQAYGVRRGHISNRVWDLGILIPWISYPGAVAELPPEPVPPSEEPVILSRNDMMQPDLRVEALQRALQAARFDPGPIDGLFGPLTEWAVFKYQHANGLEEDGEVGPQTGNALKLGYWKPNDVLPPYCQPAKTQPLPPPTTDWPSDTRPVIPCISYNAIREEYLKLWDTMAIRPTKISSVRVLAAKIVDGHARYEAVASQFPGLPWAFVGIIHAMECNCSFKRHLHNGDPIASCTVHAPKGRPPIWDPSWPWETSANDAIKIERFDKVVNWSLPEILFNFERYNGFGPRRKFGQATAYLWSYSNHYVRGKYRGDSQWDPEEVSSQPGAAVLLWQLISSGAFAMPARAP